MKKTLAALVILLSVCAALYGGFRAVADISPYFTFDNTPVGIEGLSWRNESGIQNPDWWETRQDYWADAFGRPAFLNVGFELDTQKVDMVVLVDLTQDVFAWLQMRQHMLSEL